MPARAAMDLTPSDPGAVTGSQHGHGWWLLVSSPVGQGMRGPYLLGPCGCIWLHGSEVRWSWPAGQEA